MATMTYAELTEKLMDRKGCFFTSFITQTRPKLLKKKKEKVIDAEGNIVEVISLNTFGDVEKVAHINVGCGKIYENSVNNQRQREDKPTDFVSEPLPWGQWVKRDDGSVTTLIEHKGKLYVRLEVQKSVQRQYQDANGNVLETKAVEKFLPDRDEGKRQEVDSPVIVRAYALENIKQIIADGGVVYQIE